jgi:hypothetical protein
MTVTTEKKNSSAASRFFFRVLWTHVHGGRGNSKAVLDHAMKEHRESRGIAPLTLNLAVRAGHYHQILTVPLYSSAYQLALRWNVRKQCARQLSQEEEVWSLGKITATLQLSRMLMGFTLGLQKCIIGKP